MRPIFLAVFFTVFTSPAFAQCASREATFMSCTFNNGAKAVQVCLEDGAMRYAFGPTNGPPELALSVPISELDYTPWPGISSIWEQMVFHVGKIDYVVEAGETRVYPESENDPIQVSYWGIIGVYENYDAPKTEKELALLTCDEGSVLFDWNQGFSQAKQAIGQCWSQRDFAWTVCE